ncbi:MAG: copper-binding protein [Acidobacteriota bacterium]|nr:copper-binding protein [Acidobacteriota bacterium]
MSLDSLVSRGGRSLRTLASWAFLVSACCFLAACSGDGPSEEAGQEAATVYQIRAEIQALPIPDRASPELMVRHEAVDDWTDPTGTVVGMDAMTMPFPLESEAVADGFAAGDLVEMTVEVDWDGPRPVLVTGLEALPEGTELRMRAAQPSTATESQKSDPPEMPAPSQEGGS